MQLNEWIRFALTEFEFNFFRVYWMKKKNILNCSHYVITAEVYVAQFIKTLKIMNKCDFAMNCNLLSHLREAFVNAFIILFFSECIMINNMSLYKLYIVAIELDIAHCCRFIIFQIQGFSVTRTFLQKKLEMTSFSLSYLRCKYF